MLNTHSAIMDTVRTIFMVLDASIYFLLNIVYELFFNISTFNLIDREMVFSLVSRVQLIIGIFMLFQLVMIIMKGIVNPDSITDSKSGGAGNIIMRIVVSLGLLALIVPINIASPKNEYEKQVNNNGILFGTLYSLQHRILSNNTLGKIIIGDDSTNYTSSDPDGESLNTFSKKFITPIIKSFYQLNVDDDGKYVCNDNFDDEYKDLDPFVIIASGTKHCGKNYSMTMGYLMCTFIGLVLVILMFMITFEVAKRVFQLAVLQILAPIPIISYMDPKGSKDSAFSSWVKLLTSTYLDLFIHLGAVYFAIAIIRKFVETYFTEEFVYGIIQTQKTGWVTGPLLLRWTFIVMCIGLLIFAKDAPKFIRQMLGIKSEKKFFDAFGQALGAGAVGAGVVSSGIAGGVSKYQNTEGNNGKKIRASILGALGGSASGAISGGKQFMNSKDGGAAAIMDANRKRATRIYNDAESGTPFMDRAMSFAAGNVGLKDRYQIIKDHIDANKEANRAFENSMKTLDKDGKKLNSYSRLTGTSADGRTRFTMSQLGLSNTGNYSIKDLADHLADMKSAGGGDPDKIKAMNDIVKEAKRIRLSEIAVQGDANGLGGFASFGNGGVRDITGESVYQDIQTYWKYGRHYRNDSDGVFAFLNGMRQSQDMFTTPNFGTVKGAYGTNAPNAATRMENSTEYKNAKDAHERASRKS